MELAVYAVAALPFLLLGLVAVGAAYGELAVRRSMRAMAEQRCPNCQTLFGRQAVSDARIRLAERGAAMRKQYPSLTFRIAAVWDLVCGHCGKTYDFDHSTGSVLGEHPQPEVIRG